MTTTYIPASARDRGTSHRDARRLTAHHLLLMLTTVVAVAAVALADAGRRHTQVAPAGGAGVPPIDLNHVTDVRDLEPAFGRVFADAADRRFAAEQLAAFLAVRRDEGVLPNVGALSAATIDTAKAAGSPRLVEYRDRLDAARRAASDVTHGAASPPLFTSRELALLKPAVSVRTLASFTRAVVSWTALYGAGFWLVAALWWAKGRHGDFVFLSGTHLLTAIGLAILVGLPDAERDTLLFVRYVQGVLLGLLAYAGVSLIDLRRIGRLPFSYLPLAGALTLSLLLLLFGDGPGNGSVKVNLGPVQPIEAIRLLLALFLAGYFARRWELLRQVPQRRIGTRALPAWLNMPRPAYVLPVVLGVGASLVFFFLQKDLGPALVLCCVFLATYAVARQRIVLAAFGLLALAVGFYTGYLLNISSTLVTRLEMWRRPWDNGVAGGAQVAEAIWALASGGPFGAGLGLGDTRYVPAGHTDLILALIGNELGFVGLATVVVLFAMLAIRGVRTALRAGTDYECFLAVTLTLFLIVPVVIMTAGMLGLVPLTGVVTPFLSYGGSAMVANFAALGLLTAIRTTTAVHARTASTSATPTVATSRIPASGATGRSKQDETKNGLTAPTDNAVGLTSPFRVPARWLITGVATAAVALLLVLLDRQVLHADDLAARPHLGLQGDGVRRFQYNPRLLDVIGMIPRGTIRDRDGRVLATGDAAAAARARDDYRKAGITIDRSCTAPFERCYPLGAATFHLLGDTVGRSNWTASNTSYVERDEEDRLRGFDDRAVVVTSRNADGRPVPVIRRDYRDLVPLLRHRHQPTHAVVRGFLDRPRDVTLTIDARLQSRLAARLAVHAARSASGHAAAVVVDPATGDILAAASYPMPPSAHPRQDRDGDGNDAWLDRARYGRYPPGSTFKLITAAAALRANAQASSNRFMCAWLPGGRVGARIAGWSRPVRDDVLDSHPHGPIDMHDGLVHSCNAYFAQLAVRTGATALLDTARDLGISVAASDSRTRLRDTLPQAGYGQGDVVATPLRMARMAAAIGAGGILRETTIVRRDAAAPTQAWISPTAAGTLRRYMRDAVLSGTGRSLSGHTGRIAGKTGTAEVADARSHAWFVGLAPYDAPRQLAFAVVIEHAGYGGRAAAPLAGDIVTAALDLGIIR